MQQNHHWHQIVRRFTIGLLLLPLPASAFNDAGFEQAPAVAPNSMPTSTGGGVPASTSASSTADQVQVVAKGMGIDADSALRNAYSNAIQQALGFYVDAETLVQNDQIIKDQVLTHSRGLIQEIAIVNQGTDNGLHTATIKAIVKRQPLIEKINPVLSQVVPVDMTNLHAAIVTENKQSEDAQTLLSKAIEKLSGPELFIFEIDGEPKLDEQNQNKIIVTIKAKPNIDAYNKRLSELAATLNQIATDKVDFIRIHEKEKEINIEDIISRDQGNYQEIIVNTWKSKNRLQSKWTAYLVPAECKPKLVSSITEVSLFDSSGELLALGAVKISDALFSAFNPVNKKCFFSPDVIMKPYVREPDLLSTGHYNMSNILTNEVSYNVSIDIDPSVLAEMKSVGLEVKPAPFKN